jgi:hypothetical protein
MINSDSSLLSGVPLNFSNKSFSSEKLANTRSFFSNNLIQVWKFCRMVFDFGLSDFLVKCLLTFLYVELWRVKAQTSLHIN